MNKVELLGRLTKDPDIRYTQTTNTMVANFTLAVNRRFVKEDEDRQADFISITTWNKTAEFVSKYFKKGMQIALVGRIQTRNYENNDGQKRYVTEVIAEEVYFADSNSIKKESPTDILNSSEAVDSEENFSSTEDLPF